jgi:uncharacterized membrane protein YoaK (UPF0700 family)
MAAPHSRDAVTVGRSRSVSFPPLAVVLAVAAGAMDAACFTRLGQVFAGVMTGNLTLLGLAAANRSAGLAGHIALALGGYVTGAAVGSVTAQRSAHGDTTRRRPVLLVLLTELAVLAGFTAGWVLTGGHPAGAAQLGLLAAATVATGLQAAAVRSVGTKLSTTYLTGTLTAAVAGLVTGGQSRSSIRWSLAVLAAHAAGAAAAGGLLLVAPITPPLLPDVALLVVLSIVSANDAAPRP